MKRSEINKILLDAKSFMAQKQFILPPWAYWSVEDWKENKESAHEVIENMLGWDITDFGSGDFYKRGLFLFTIRNGKLHVDKKPNAEKIMIVEENQETPMHFHWSKMEDNEKVRLATGGHLAELARKLSNRYQRPFKVDSFILLRDSSPMGKPKGQTPDTTEEREIIEQMKAKHLLRLDWHEYDESGNKRPRFRHDKTYLDVMFGVIER